MQTTPFENFTFSREVNVVTVTGQVSHNESPELLARIRLAIDQGCTVINFSGVEVVDSAAVALLVLSIGYGAQRGVELETINLPENLKTLALLYGVRELLGVKNHH